MEPGGAWILESAPAASVHIRYRSSFPRRSPSNPLLLFSSSRTRLPFPSPRTRLPFPINRNQNTVGLGEIAAQTNR